MIKKALWVGLALSLVGLVMAPGARADDTNKKTVLTFSQPVEIPGHILPAGTYTFKLVDTIRDRQIVQISRGDESEIIATVMTIPNYRIRSTDETVIRFREMPAGSPEAIRAWFYPGDTTGRQFVYPKARALVLAKASKDAVPAIAVEVSSPVELKTVSVFAVTPDEREAPLATAILTTPPAAANMTGVRETEQLPKTASYLPLIALFGVVVIALALGLVAFGKRISIPA